MAKKTKKAKKPAKEAKHQLVYWLLALTGFILGLAAHFVV